MLHDKSYCEPHITQIKKEVSKGCGIFAKVKQNLCMSLYRFQVLLQ